jgi:ferredoxin
VLVGDCACDPPLGATARALAVARADDVLYGLAALALERKIDRLLVRARHADAHDALARAIARLNAEVELELRPDAWPPAPGDDVVPADALMRAADRARDAAPRVYTTVAGAVRAPCVIAARAGATALELLALADGPLVDDWVAIAGGAPSGRLVARDAPVDDPLLLVLPAGHDAVRRLRTPIADWLVRAASACEGCRLCSDACPAPLAPHAIVWTLATPCDDGTDLARALHCTACGLCDAMCPSTLSPRALTIAVRDRLRAAAITAPTADQTTPKPGLDVDLLTLRLGLQPFAHTPTIRL